MTSAKLIALSAVLSAALAAAALAAAAQQPGQPDWKIDTANRTLAVSATETVNADADVAILHIGFETSPADAKTAYALGAHTSNAIVAAVKQAGVAESDIHSESQYLEPDTTPKSHKFKLAQQWTVKTTPARAAEILDDAITAGANSSGEIEWTFKDEHALEEQALDKAAARARENAAVLAKGMEVRLGSLLYVSNQLATPVFPRPMMRSFAMAAGNAEAPPPLAIEPHKVSREATVYAVFAIE
ncbi:MAG TPA: SIMPL domain-containing protein [Terracidiphilus sp.]|nr:SIMPL domain-containing protein [Terracidiphilus sp.]